MKLYILYIIYIIYIICFCRESYIIRSLKQRWYYPMWLFISGNLISKFKTDNFGLMQQSSCCNTVYSIIRSPFVTKIANSVYIIIFTVHFDGFNPLLLSGIRFIAGSSQVNSFWNAGQGWSQECYGVCFIDSNHVFWGWYWTFPGTNKLGFMVLFL